MRAADWINDGNAIRAIRERVFVGEQDVPADLEYDGRDPDCWHVLAETPEGTAIATGRLAMDGRIGRMAVDREWRGRGVGRALLDALIERARSEGLARVVLHAQTGALGFYARAGFRAHGPIFEEAGIPHREMERSIRDRRFAK